MNKISSNIPADITSKLDVKIGFGKFRYINRSVEDRDAIANHYYNIICHLLPGFKELINHALECIPDRDLPLFLNVPGFCLDKIEPRLKNGGRQNE